MYFFSYLDQVKLIRIKQFRAAGTQMFHNSLIKGRKKYYQTSTQKKKIHSIKRIWKIKAHFPKKARTLWNQKERIDSSYQMINFEQGLILNYLKQPVFSILSDKLFMSFSGLLITYAFSLKRKKITFEMLTCRCFSKLLLLIDAYKTKNVMLNFKNNSFKFKKCSSNWEPLEE